MKLRPALFAAAFTLASFCAHAQTQVPGLWEHTFSMKSTGGETEKALAEMQKQMASMPPEQRKQVEQMMASRGVGMGVGGATVVKVCVTKDDAARKAEPQFQEGCTQQVVQRTANTMKVKFQCTQPRPMTGEGEMTFISDKAYTGKSTVTSEANGKPQQMSMEMAGKWLGADCGDVKPRPAPAK
jgi:Protein of unknown function (DUF3617)